MKKLFVILPLALILCFMVGCQDKEKMEELEEFRAQAAVEEQNKEILRRYFRAVENGDLEAVKEIFSPDCILHHTTGQDLSLEETIETVKKQNEQSKVAFPDFNLSIEELLTVEDRVIVRLILRGTHKGDWRGIPATGNKFEISSTFIVRIENGKVVEEREDFDQLGFLQQLGFELKLKEEK